MDLNLFNLKSLTSWIFFFSSGFREEYFLLSKTQYSSEFIQCYCDCSVHYVSRNNSWRLTTLVVIGRTIKLAHFPRWWHFMNIRDTIHAMPCTLWYMCSAVCMWEVTGKGQRREKLCPFLQKDKHSQTFFFPKKEQTTVQLSSHSKADNQLFPSTTCSNQMFLDNHLQGIECFLAIDGHFNKMPHERNI